MCFCFSSLISGVRASSVETVRTGQGAYLTRAIYADSALWVLTDAGTVTRIEEGSEYPVAVDLAEPALDLWIQDGAPAVVTGARTGGGDFTVRRWSQGAWSVMGHVPANHERLLGVAADADGLTLLTPTRLIKLKGAEYQQMPVSWPGHKAPGGVTAIFGDANSLLLGINAGEWGGGLLRVDRKSGHAQRIESKLSSDLCGGPLNSQCDPVNAIVAEPHVAGCVLIAIGLVHFSPHGRIDEVCGTRVRRVFFTPYLGDDSIGGKTMVGDEPSSTVAFFGLATIKDAVFAAAPDGIYKIGSHGTAAFMPLPAFHQVGDIRVSFGLPDLVVALTDVNARHSLGGSVPMLVAR
jgi:hypothetical protein